MTLSLRACLGTAPALVVVAGSFLLSRVYFNEVERDRQRRLSPDNLAGETIVGVSAENADRMHRVALKEETVTDLLEGRLSLAAAVQRFEQMARLDENGDIAGARFGGSGTRQILYQIQSFARSQAACFPERLGPQFAQLREEIASYTDEPRVIN